MPTTCRVHVTQGEVQGTIAKNYIEGEFYQFLGVPYAASPIGPLRFRAPQRAEKWQGILDCTKPGPECPSLHTYFYYNIGSESDCLNLNIYTKSLNPGCSRPVMVFVHGGGFFNGCNKPEFFGPRYFMTEEIVLITVNYRTGILGFLSLEKPALNVPGNAGLKDIVQALRWIKENVHQFGGDCNNVTLFGESAGGAAVHYLYLSPMAKGLFHKAIIMSGCALNLCWARGKRGNGQIVADFVGYKGKDDEEEILCYLQGLPAKKIVKAMEKALQSPIGSYQQPIGPVIEAGFIPDNAILTIDPLDVIETGTFNDVPLIIGYNSLEGMLFQVMKNASSKITIPRDLRDEIPYKLCIERESEAANTIANHLQNFYFKGKRPQDASSEQLWLLKGDSLIIHGLQKTCKLQKMTSKSPIFLYRFTLKTSLNIQKKLASLSKFRLILVGLVIVLTYFINFGCLKKFLRSISNWLADTDSVEGACHGDIINYLFNSSVSAEVEKNSPEEVGIKRMLRLWVNFAETGNPTPGGEHNKNDQILGGCVWKAVTEEENNFLNIGSELVCGIDPDKERMDLWDTIHNAQ